jgi:hypothetical protein
VRELNYRRSASGVADKKEAPAISSDFHRNDSPYRMLMDDDRLYLVPITP